jgi:hypothetical protein
MSVQYWVIRHRISFLSDVHVGAGITLLGGNLHGLKLDDNGFPYMPHSQVRGLLRLGGDFLKDWCPSVFNDLHSRNFNLPGPKPQNDTPSWSFTRAGIAPENLHDEPDLIGQSHIKRNNDGVVENLFSFQKAGRAKDCFFWQGSLFSTGPATERDAAFMIAAMRAEDRIGHRRTRGYGKVIWEPEAVYCFDPGDKDKTKVERTLDDWLEIPFSGAGQ